MDLIKVNSGMFSLNVAINQNEGFCVRNQTSSKSAAYLETGHVQVAKSSSRHSLHGG